MSSQILRRGIYFRFRANTFRYHFRLGFFIFCLFFVVLCSILGVWQLHRYHEKKNILFLSQEHLQGDPKPFIPFINTLLHLSKQPLMQQLAFQKISVDGYYRNDMHMLVQNQRHDEKLGFEILTPLQLAHEQKLLLVDRGWIEALDQQKIPMLERVIAEQHIKGYIKIFNEYQFILGDNILNTQKFPLIMQKIDINELSKITKKPFFPFVVRLDPASSNGFLRDWNMVTGMPVRHIAYAVQWFLFALVIIVAYLIVSCEKHHVDER